MKETKEVLAGSKTAMASAAQGEQQQQQDAAPQPPLKFGFKGTLAAPARVLRARVLFSRPTFCILIKARLLASQHTPAFTRRPGSKWTGIYIPPFPGAKPTPHPPQEPQAIDFQHTIQSLLYVLTLSCPAKV